MTYDMDRDSALPPEVTAKCQLLEITLVKIPLMKMWVVARKDGKWLRAELTSDRQKYAPAKDYFTSYDKAINKAIEMMKSDAFWY